MKDKAPVVSPPQNTCGFGYVLGMIGSAVYFVQHTAGFWPVVLALLKAVVWPAFVVYYLLKFLIG